MSSVLPEDNEDGKMTVTYAAAKLELLEAALTHVPFDGWSEATLREAIRDTGIDSTIARAVCPRGAVDLAIAFHVQGDEKMLERIAETDMSGLKFRDQVATAVRLRLDSIEDKEVVRRGATLFALPIYAADGAKLIWGTSDKIWTALGDTSTDYNWYTKRATLSGVYSSTALYWLGDNSPDHAATWEFLDRRIGDVMQIEKMKAKARQNPVLSKMLAMPERLLGKIRPPSRVATDTMPGSWTSPRKQPECE